VGWDAAVMISDGRDVAADGELQRDVAPDAEVSPSVVRQPVVSTGNPRVMVAFPFSKIEVREPSDEIRDLAAVVWALAEQVAALVRQTAPDQTGAADQVAAQATLVAQRLGGLAAPHRP
jgi:hypothetical protein